MALVKFIETTSDKLDSLPIIEGRFTFTKDDGKLYLDTMDSTNTEVERFLINDDTPATDTGDTSGLGALAYKDSATGTVTPAGTVSAPIFTGDISTANIDLSGLTGVTQAYTPTGTVSAPTITVDSINVKTADDLVINTETFGTIESNSYTPTGTVSAPTITNTTTKSTVYSISSVGTLPTMTPPALDMYINDEENHVLRIDWDYGSFSAGTLPSRSSVSVVTGVTSEASAPTFTGTASTITTDLSNLPEYVSEVKSGDTYTPISITATASQPTFTGTSATLTVDIDSAESAAVSFTPTGTISQPEFTGTAMTVRVS